MIGLRSQPAGKVGSTAKTLESQKQQTASDIVPNKSNVDLETQRHTDMNKGRKELDRKSQTPVYVPPAKRKQEVRFAEKPMVVPDLTDEEMERIMDQPAVMPRRYSVQSGNRPELDSQNGNEVDRGFTIPEIDELDRTLEKAWEDAEALKGKTVARDSTSPRLPTQTAGRAYDSVQPLQIKPMPINTPKPTGKEESKPVVEKANEPQYRVRTELFKEGAEEEIADRIFKQKVELTPEEIATISPKVRRILLRKTQNKRVEPQKRLSQTVFLSTVDENGEEHPGSPHQVLQKYIRVEDVFLAQEDVFETLTQDVGDLKAGSIVQKDPVEAFRRDMAEDDERRNLSIVASTGNALRAVFPIINGKDENIEATLDSGSQIVAIDNLVAIAMGATWDPEFTIQMQDVHGGVARTMGLARNVPFRFGDVTVYLQCHVQSRAPFMVLLGRPFDVLTESVVQNFGNGDQEITITDPNSKKKCTIGTYERGVKLKKKLTFDTSRYEEPLHRDQAKVSPPTEAEASVSFQSSEI